MAKRYDFEVSTRMSIIEPEEFQAELAILGADVFDRPRQSGYYVTDNRGVGVRPKDQHFSVFSRNRFIHYDRVIEQYGTIGLQFFRLLQQIDPAMGGEENIGGIDLNCEIAKELKNRIGEYSVRGQAFTFDRIEDIPSERNPDSRLFVLRQESDLLTVDPLQVVSDFVSTTIRNLNQEIHQLGTDESRKVENGLLIGITDDINPDRISTFKERFGIKFFGDEPDKGIRGQEKIHAQASDVEVRNKSEH